MNFRLYFMPLTVVALFLPIYGAHDRDRTGEPLPYQGSALPTELRGPAVERETGLEPATLSLEGRSSGH